MNINAKFFLALLGSFAFCGAVPVRSNLLAAAEPREAPPQSNAPAARESKGAATTTDLRRQLTDYLNQSKYVAALWGVKVISLDAGTTVFEFNPQKLFSPASNSKLYTVALALDRLGPDYRIKTSLYASSKPDAAGVLHGDLIIYGRGDPTMNARFHRGEINNALKPIVEELHKAGVKHVEGDLIGDESYFRGPSFGSGWSYDDLSYSYGAAISALTINDNVAQVSARPGEQTGMPCRLISSTVAAFINLSNRTSTVEKGQAQTLHFFRPLNESVIYALGQMPVGAATHVENLAVPSPAKLFASLLKDALSRGGIEVSGKTRTMDWLDRQVEPIACDQMVELGAVESPPVRELAKEILKPSQNLYTDLLLAHVGEKNRTPKSPTDETSEQLGIRELSKFTAHVGIKQSEVLFDEGSGLSRNNLTTPNATVALVQFMDRHPCATIYLEALPVAGVDGTLINRMKGTAAERNLRAKTGTSRWVSSLSGHVKTAAGERLVFSIMLNRFQGTSPGRSAAAELDPVAVMLAEFKGRVGD